ncbi:hypothetical protein Cylst_2112 [Cylindrospermum stagnale PCC 7417]|uniref:Glycosyltransferase RgtA/B/C/D-like domain-containing protein n=1 Tax=Cylindrospermum stagnale PCC 7417 TaxID=56107 RepID=K9WX27_9NOST|nr:hypothetical protein [Cylindrospermum stagnale]AFZ24351.1 hypothetical protein Cylst_2112 [Cylindrospermum stagnale PCC 7417]
MLAKKVSSRISQLPFNSPWFIIIIFSVLGLIGILNHSMWRDELNPWLIVRDSESFADLLANINYEGHPVLWYFCLALLKRIADTPVVMQLFHLGIATGSVTIFWLYSPFNYRQKLLFSFGFFPFSEYLLISRNYAFSMLFIFAFCAVFSTRKRTYLYLGIFLGLLANSNAYGLFVSVSLLLTLLVEFCFDIEQRNQYLIKSKNSDLFLSILIILFFYLLAIYIITPPADSYLHGGLSNGWFLRLDIRHLFKCIGRLFGGYFLIIPTSKRWLDLIICAIIALFIVGLTLIKLIKKPVPLFFYIITNCVILAFSYFRFIGDSRHFGHFYLVLLAALWLGSYYQESRLLINKLSGSEQVFNFGNKWHNIALMLILYVHLCGGIYYFCKDLIIPFSSSRETVNYIQTSRLDNEFIVASRDANMAAISGYMNRKFYYPERQEIGSFTIFKKGRQAVDQDEILRQLSSLLENQVDRNRILLILNDELKFSRNDLKIMPIKNFERGWVDSERFYLYWVLEK